MSLSATVINVLSFSTRVSCHSRSYQEDTKNTHTHSMQQCPLIFLLSFFSSFPAIPPPKAARSSNQPHQDDQGLRPSVRPMPGQGHGQASDLFDTFLYLGFISGGNPCEHCKTMQTPHRDARQMGHLSAEKYPERFPFHEHACHSTALPTSFSQTVLPRNHLHLHSHGPKTPYNNPRWTRVRTYASHTSR